MTSLDSLGEKFLTDKSSKFSWAYEHGHGYCDIYERYFKHMRHDPVNLVELGVYKAGSIRMWDEFFDHPDSHFWAVDQDTRCFGKEHRITFHRIDQGNPRLASVLLADNTYDIIIDDCSHQSELTVMSFDMLWPLVKPGGFYAVEDLKCQEEAQKYLQRKRKDAEITLEKAYDDSIIFLKKL